MTHCMVATASGTRSRNRLRVDLIGRTIEYWSYDRVKCGLKCRLGWCLAIVLNDFKVMAAKWGGEDALPRRVQWRLWPYKNRLARA
jgi:hypothetical protein